MSDIESQIPPANSTSSLDFIGDIHGYASTLERLLEQLDYRRKGDSWRHPQGRRVVFLGDYIDRGPQIRETLHLVKRMVDRGDALAVMGNHEYNAVCFHTPDGQGDFLRSHSAEDGKNVKQHQATLDAFAGLDDEWAQWIDWFKQLPFALDLGGARAVHATWDDELVEFLDGKTLADETFLKASAIEGTPEFVAVEAVLKGIEVALPKGEFFDDKQDVRRSKIRVRWWQKPEGRSYRDLVFPDCDSVSSAAAHISKGDIWQDYLADAPPVFFGHYWLPGNLSLQPVANNAACLDYSVAKDGGKLVAYRWDGEREIDGGKFVAVERSVGISDSEDSPTTANRSLAGSAAEC